MNNERFCCDGRCCDGPCPAIHQPDNGEVNDKHEDRVAEAWLLAVVFGGLCAWAVLFL